MMKNIFYPIILLQMILIASCLQSPQDYGYNGDQTAEDNTPIISEASLISDIDEYVNDIRENIEETAISKETVGNEQKVVFIKDNDTVKISVMTDMANTRTDIYFHESEPIFASRNVILDVDSAYLETAYFKDGELFKCFCNGTEVNNHLYASEFMRHIAR